MNCEHIQSFNIGDERHIYTGEDADCHHPNSVKVSNSALRIDKTMDSCNFRNKDNNCKDFEQRYYEKTIVDKRFLGIPIKYKKIKVAVAWEKDDD